MLFLKSVNRKKSVSIEIKEQTHFSFYSSHHVMEFRRDNGRSMSVQISNVSKLKFHVCTSVAILISSAKSEDDDLTLQMLPLGLMLVHVCI